LPTQSASKRRPVIKQGGETETPIERVLSRLAGAQPEQGGKSWMAHCPAHDDSTPSLHVTVEDDGRVLMYCHGGCETKAVLEALGLTWGDLFQKNGNGARGGYPPETPATVQPSKEHPEKSMGLGLQGHLQPGTTTQPAPEGCTLAQYAEAKRLPPDVLREWGLRDCHWGGRSAVYIPFFDPDGNVAAVRFRTALVGKDRFRWKLGAKPCLYGLQWLDGFRDFGYVVLVEGESDCHTLWLHGIPALGLPSATGWKEEWAALLDDFETIYVVIEPDRGGEAVLKWLAASSIRERVRLVELGEHKDPSALYLADPEHFSAHFQDALEAAISWEEETIVETEAAEREARAQCAELAQAPRILDRFAESLAQCGVVGEDQSS
jgi:hypothetical protein